MDEPETNLLGKTRAIVGFHSPHGGAGATVLAAHFASFAAACHVPTLGVSLDENGHLFRMLTSDHAPLVDCFLDTADPWAAQWRAERLAERSKRVHNAESV